MITKKKPFSITILGTISGNVSSLFVTKTLYNYNAFGTNDVSVWYLEDRTIRTRRIPSVYPLYIEEKKLSVKVLYTATARRNEEYTKKL